MPPVPFDFDPWKAEIQLHAATEKTWPEIARIISAKAERSISERVLRRQYTEWGFQRRTRIDRREEVVQYIVERVQSTRDNDRTIAKRLSNTGLRITSGQVAKIRRENGLLRRLDSEETQLLRQQVITEAMQREIQEGSVRQYGRELMTTHLRRKKNIATRFDSSISDGMCLTLKCVQR
jgi:hypothetical protein